MPRCSSASSSWRPGCSGSPAWPCAPRSARRCLGCCRGAGAVDLIRRALYGRRSRGALPVRRGHLLASAAGPEIAVERVSVARRAHVYPQVSLTAADLVDTPVVAAPSSITVSDALRLSRRRHARVLACGSDAHVLVEDLARAETLGLGDLAAAELWRPLPVVEPHAPELRVRRVLSEGAAAVIVRGRAGGAVVRGVPPRAVSLVARMNAAVPASTREVLSAVTRLAAAHGARAFLAGGLVRDVWRGETSAARDLDVVIEGDGPGIARALAGELGGALVEHERFLTASVETAEHGRIDIVTARTERYERPGALPRVLPGSIAQDLRRRDFTVNAMAVELDSGTFGLLDPLRSEEHTSELQSPCNLVCRLLLEKKKQRDLHNP